MNTYFSFMVIYLGGERGGEILGGDTPLSGVADSSGVLPLGSAELEEPVPPPDSSIWLPDPACSSMANLAMARTAAASMLFGR